eukprot:144388_1
MIAVWYQGINENHQIYPNQAMQTDHVLALILYAQCTELCTAFRETYRKLDENEPKDELISRHEEFANMGRLIYESFVFFASTASQVKTLYHGMTIQLLFKTLYCTFSAPTSTTTAQSTASNFCGGTGIVMQFE